MDENMQNQMNAILNNPEMMQKIMSMAQALKPNEPPQGQAEQAAPAAAFPDIDIILSQNHQDCVKYC